MKKFKDIELAQLRLEERKSYQNHITRLKADYEQKIVDMQQEMLFLEEKETKRWAAREHVCFCRIIHRNLHYPSKSRHKIYVRKYLI